MQDKLTGLAVLEMKKKRKVSMQDIADQLGVSKGTISLVLSGKAESGRISEEMCRKVRATAEEMNYQPNEIARSLSTGKTMTIGVIVSDISNEFFGSMTFHIQEQAKKYGYTVVTTNTNENLDEFNKMVTILLNKQVDGIIFVPVDNGQHIAARITKRHIPLVQIDRFYSDLEASYIVVDNYKISAKTTEHLILKGLKRIAVICYDFDVSALIERRQGCIDTLSKYNLLDPGLIKNIRYQYQEEDLKQAIHDLKNNSDKIDAIFFCSRKVFITGVKYMYKNAISIPEDMEVVCFDKIDSFAIANIPIIYIEQPIRKMGEKAVDILMEQMNGSNDRKQFVFDTELKYIN
ncbi:MAG: LacI family transcriptional regulator [Porphyromonadaceae bacterium]|nr:LacI family transcriptional regulator [Porphyromonadaceae bacterium]